MLPKCTFFLAQGGVVGPGESVKLVGVTPGMVAPLSLSGQVWVESRPRLLRRSSLAVAQESLPPSLSLEAPSRPGLGQKPPPTAAASSHSRSQEPLRRRPASSLPLAPEESLPA